MNKNIMSVVFVLTFVVSGFVSPKLAFAQAEETCVCHVTGEGSNTVCSSEEGAINGHLGHGDTLGACAVPTITPTPTPAEPSVPEFGLVTGLVTAAMSYGSFMLLKRKV